MVHSGSHKVLKRIFLLHTGYFLESKRYGHFFEL